MKLQDLRAGRVRLDDPKAKVAAKLADPNAPAPANANAGGGGGGGRVARAARALKFWKALDSDDHCAGTSDDVNFDGAVTPYTAGDDADADAGGWGEGEAGAGADGLLDGAAWLEGAGADPEGPAGPFAALERSPLL
eukprot:tig00000215_g18658.t1